MEGLSIPRAQVCPRSYGGYGASSTGILQKTGKTKQSGVALAGKLAVSQRKSHGFTPIIRFLILLIAFSNNCSKISPFNYKHGKHLSQGQLSFRRNIMPQIFGTPEETCEEIFALCYRTGQAPRLQ